MSKNTKNMIKGIICRIVSTIAMFAYIMFVCIIANIDKQAFVCSQIASIMIVIVCISSFIESSE